MVKPLIQGSSARSWICALSAPSVNSLMLRSHRLTAICDPSFVGLADPCGRFGLALHIIKREAIGTARNDRQLLEGVQYARRDRADVVSSSLNREAT